LEFIRVLIRSQRLAGRHDRVEYAGHQVFDAQQGRTGRQVAYFLDWATHIDVDVARAARRVERGGLGHHGRVGAGDLYGHRSDLAVVVEAPRGLDAFP